MLLQHPPLLNDPAEMLQKPVAHLGLDSRFLRALERMGTRTLGELTSLIEREVQREFQRCKLNSSRIEEIKFATQSRARIG